MIFVSYSSHDREAAASLCLHLRASGVPYWLDSEHLEPPFRPGMTAQEVERAVRETCAQLQSAIGKARAVALVDTHASRRSAWVTFELWVAACYGTHRISMSPRAIKYPDPLIDPTAAMTAEITRTAPLPLCPPALASATPFRPAPVSRRALASSTSPSRSDRCVRRGAGAAG